MDTIWAYVSERNAAASDRLIEQFIEASARLEDYPYSGPQRDDIAPTARAIVVGSYVILYRVTEEWVDIVRIVHGARDLGQFAGDFE